MTDRTGPAEPSPVAAPAAGNARPRVLARLIEDDFLGIRYAAIVFVAATMLWLILSLGANTTPVWAISSMVAVIDPHLKAALATFRGRIINSMLGCSIGLIFLMVGTETEWKLPMALAATVLLSSYFLRVEFELADRTDHGGVRGRHRADASLHFGRGRRRPQTHRRGDPRLPDRLDRLLAVRKAVADARGRAARGIAQAVSRCGKFAFARSR